MKFYAHIHSHAHIHTVAMYIYVNVMLYSIKEKMATGYNDGKEVAHSDLGWAAPAGQMYSTVNDLMKVKTLIIK